MYSIAFIEHSRRIDSTYKKIDSLHDKMQANASMLYPQRERRARPAHRNSSGFRLAAEIQVYRWIESIRWEAD